VIELCKIFPIFSRVASLATQSLAGRPCLQHPILKLPTMYIRVTTGTTQLIPVIRRLLLGQRRIAQLVAIAAGRRQVSADQLEADLFVSGQRER